MNTMTQNMRVTKRDGTLELVAFDKISMRVQKICADHNIQINYTQLVIKVIEQMYDTISTSLIDELCAEQCAYMSANHIDYSKLAGYISISNHHKNTENSFKRVVHLLYHNKNMPLISDDIYDIMHENPSYSDKIEDMIVYSRDYLIDYFGFKTLYKSYLMKQDGKVVDRPQHLWMRVALAIHGTDLELVKETYDLMSTKVFTHATPTLFNAGTPHPQLSSCYLVSMEDDSIEGIFNTVKECAQISKWAGGIGLHIHNIRASNSLIRGTNGRSSGIIPMLKVFNDTAKFVNQGGKRNGSFAIYLEPWHADIEDFLDLKKNHGNEEMRARDLFYALWVSDLFMQRVEKNQSWSLFCPDTCPGLSDAVGESFVELYTKYENMNYARKTINARDLWYKILDAQMETGTPYLLYKDSANLKSNQQHLGTIKSSNLCCEIMEYSDKNESAVCNLASIALPSFVDLNNKVFDFGRLHQVVKIVTNNLNKIIDINAYPTPKTKISNLNHRPIGIGIQGLADVFILLDFNYESNEAKLLNRHIFETIYHASLEKSNELAILEGPHPSFKGSPASKGILQFDMWDIQHTDTERYDWAQMKQDIIRSGLRNSLLVAPMPTASTSQIFGYTECFEPITSNLYSRRTIAGEFMVVNKYLMQDLMKLDYWNSEVKNSIIEHKGSIQQLTDLPQQIRDKYKIVWEMSMKNLIDMSADRGAYICQSQSLNLWVENPNYAKLSSMHFYAWKKGLKTGIYYLRRKAKHHAQQFTIEPVISKEQKEQKENNTEYTNTNISICESCSA